MELKKPGVTIKDLLPLISEEFRFEYELVTLQGYYKNRHKYLKRAA